MKVGAVPRVISAPEIDVNPRTVNRVVEFHEIFLWEVCREDQSFQEQSDLLNLKPNNGHLGTPTIIRHAPQLALTPTRTESLLDFLAKQPKMHQNQGNPPNIKFLRVPGHPGITPGSPRDHPGNTAGSPRGISPGSPRITPGSPRAGPAGPGP